MYGFLHRIQSDCFYLCFLLISTSQEVYKDAEAVAFHKEQPHFALWTAFKVALYNPHTLKKKQCNFRAWIVIWLNAFQRHVMINNFNLSSPFAPVGERRRCEVDFAQSWWAVHVAMSEIWATMSSFLRTPASFRGHALWGRADDDLKLAFPFANFRKSIRTARMLECSNYNFNKKLCVQEKFGWTKRS